MFGAQGHGAATPCPPVQSAAASGSARLGSVSCLRPPPLLAFRASSASLGRRPADRLPEEASCPYPTGLRRSGGRSDAGTAANDDN